MFHLYALINDPESPAYYYSFILSTIVCLVVLLIISQMIRKSYNKRKDLEDSLLHNIPYEADFIKRKDSLRFRYLFCYLIIKSNIWAKSPYLWALYHDYHLFSIQEIGILYLIDNLSALIFGPITGNLADIFGRKFFCISYCISVIINLSMRLTGNHFLAYVAQIISGISAALVNTTFESWVNFEATKEFRDRLKEKERFLRKLFKTQTIFDALISIAASIFAAILFDSYGLKAPIICAIILVTIGMTCIFFMWDENQPNKNSKHTFRQSFNLALNELKKREVLSIGVIEGLYQGVFLIFIFAWTPILILSTDESKINLGSISICFVMMTINCTILYEIVILNLGMNPYLGLSFSLISASFFFGIVFYFESFYIRLIFLSCINGLSGFFNPLNSIIKANILEEKYRALLMNIFRMPLNFYVIVTLITIQYLNPMIICLICGMMTLMAFLIGISMKIWPIQIEPKKLEIIEEIDEIFDEIIEQEINRY